MSQQNGGYNYNQPQGYYAQPPPQQNPYGNQPPYYQQATYPPVPSAAYYPPPNGAFYPPPPMNNSVYPEQTPNSYPPNYSSSPSAQTYKPNNYNDSATASNIKINQKPEYKDVWAVFLFLATVAGFIVCLVVGLPYLKDLKTDGSSQGSNNNSGVTIFNATDMSILVAGSVVGSVALAIGYTALLLRFPGKMIKLSMVFQVILMVLTTIALFIFGSVVAGIISALVTALIAWILWSMRSRIPFAKVMLTTTIGIMKKYPATLFTAFIGTVVLAALSATWVLAVIGISTALSQKNSSGATTYVALVFLLFSFYWMSQVVRYVVHVTVSGVFATYYFEGVSTAGGEVQVSTQNPTLGAAKRAMTYSFGSICFGALIIAIIQTLRALLRSAANQAAEDRNLAGLICAICANCILGCLEDILEYFNFYAFTEVAIYGKGYVEAAKATWRLVKERGIDALINDSLIHSVLAMGSFIVGLLGAAFGAIIVGSSPRIPNTAANFIVAALLSFFIAIVIFSTMISVIESGVAATFVCLAEDPRALQRTKPELFEKVRQTYPNVMLHSY